MPRVNVPVQQFDSMAGEALAAATAGDAANDHEFDNDGRTVLYVKNTGAGAVVVTIPMKADDFGRTGNKSSSVPATTGESFFGPFDPAVFNGAGTPAAAAGRVAVDIDVATGVTLRALKIAEKGV